MSRHVLLVTGSDYTPEIYEALFRLKNEGITFSLLSDGSFKERNPIFDHHLKYDLRKTSETIQHVVESKLHFDAITQKSSEWLTTLVALLQKEFKLSGTSPQAAFRCRSKIHMREWMKKHSLPSPQCARVKNFEELWNAVETFNPPVVAKPLGGNASYGTFLIQDFSEKEAIKERYETSIDYLKRMSIDMDVFSFTADELTQFGVSEFYDLTTDYLVEEYIQGYKNISIDSIVHDGEVTSFAIAEQTRMKPPYFLQEREIIPAAIAPSELPEILELNQRAIQAFEITQSAVHLEMILTKRGPVLLELACRIGGDNIHNSTLTTTGYHLLEEQIRVALGDKRSYSVSPTSFSATEYLLPTSLPQTWHEVEELTVPENFQDQYSVSEWQMFASSGTKIAPPPLCYDFYGYVTCNGNSPEEAKAKVQKAAHSIIIRVKPTT